MKFFSEIETFVQNELKKIGAGLHSGEQKLLGVASISNKVLNAAKAWTASPGGATLLSVIEAIPGAGPIAQTIVNTILPDALKVVALVQADATNPEALVSASVSAVLASPDGDAIASKLNSVQAIMTNKIAPLLNIKSTIGAALSIAQSVYASSK